MVILLLFGLSVCLLLPVFLILYFIFKDVLSVWRSADAVCFDVDSTVCLDEGIDELADFCGAGQAVAEWTTRSELVFFYLVILCFCVALGWLKPTKALTVG